MLRVCCVVCLKYRTSLRCVMRTKTTTTLNTLCFSSTARNPLKGMTLLVSSLQQDFVGMWTRVLETSGCQVATAVQPGNGAKLSWQGVSCPDDFIQTSLMVI